MAKNFQSSNRINSLSLRQFSFCIALVCLLKIHQVSGIECGTVDVLEPVRDYRIISGTGTRRAEWPFVAALYRTNPSRYFCGGTVISNRHVLTAAHCIQGKDAARKLAESDIEVLLGAYDLSAKFEEDVKQRNVNKIHVHPDWKWNEADYDADIAILELNDNVTFSSYIRPVCLPADDAIVNSAARNFTGVIVGWGLDRNGSHEEILQSAHIQGLNDSYCYRKNHDIVELSSDRTFCGVGLGNVVGTPSRGDSGGGFFYHNGEVYEQYGIISSIRVSSTGQVVQEASLYTNVRSFKDWIVLQLLDKIVLTCEYLMDYWIGYVCEVRDLDIRTENIVESFIGSHDIGKSDEDVKAIEFRTGTMHCLPNGIGKLFKNLEKVRVHPGLGTKLITQANFQNLEKLRHLVVLDNKIEILPFDTLWELPVLEQFEIFNNKLKTIDGRTFEKNEKLKRVDLHHNRLEFLPRNLFKNNRLLEYVDFHLNIYLRNIATDFSALTNIKYIDLEGTGCSNICYSRNPILCENDLLEFQRQIVSRCTSQN